jgi:hypothetical protein
MGRVGGGGWYLFASWSEGRRGLEGDGGRVEVIEFDDHGCCSPFGPQTRTPPPYIVDPVNLGDSLSEQLSTQFPIRLLNGGEYGAAQDADGHGFGAEGRLPRNLVLLPLLVGQGSAEACQESRRGKQVGAALPLDLRQDDQLVPLLGVVQPPPGAEGVAEAALPLAAAQGIAVRLGLEGTGASLTPQLARRPVQIYRWPLW